MDLLIKCNVGNEERRLRLLAGVLAAVGAFYAPKRGMKAALGAVSAMGIGTGMTRYCPLNHLLGINRCQPAYRSVKQLLRRI